MRILFQMLGTLATTDESNSVRVAAVGAIGNYKGEPAKRLLGQGDSRSVTGASVSSYIGAARSDRK